METNTNNPVVAMVSHIKEAGNFISNICGVLRRRNPLPQRDISSCNSACDADLKSFDSNLHDLITGAINRLADSVKDRSPSNDHFLSLDYVTEVSNSFSKVNGEVVKVIDNQNEKIWKNKLLLDLVDDYTQISHKTIKFFTDIEKRISRAHNNLLNIQLVVQQFDEEQQGNGGVEGSEKNLYSKTLETLEKFKMKNDKFPEEFFRLVYSLCDDHVSMVQKLKDRDNKMDKKLKETDDIKTWKMVSMTIFRATSTLISVCLAVEVAVVDPLVLTAVAAAAPALPWIWKEYENKVKGQRDLMRRKTSSAVWDLNYICEDVDNLETKIKALLQQDAEFAIVEEDAKAVEEVIADIKPKLTAFKEAIQNLDERNEVCRRDTRKAMIDVLDKIKKYSST